MTMTRRLSFTPFAILLPVILLFSANVIFKGTASTGTAMWNSWIGGIGRVEYTYPFYPYIVVNKVQPPSISGLQQFKSDATSTIDEGQTTTEDTVVFGATLQSSSTDKLYLEIQASSTESGIVYDAISTSVDPGTFATTSLQSLPDGHYSWQAKAVDVSTSSTSPWQPMSATSTTDFVVHQVPLYTQVQSDFPDATSTGLWSTEQYGSGHYPDCLDTNTNPEISTIRRCGCAIASMSMLGRYYGVATGTDNSSVNPGTMNTWLSGNDGYKSYNATSGTLVDNGNLNWGKAAEYLGVTESGIKKTYLSLDYYNAPATTQRSTIDNYINSLKPAIAYSNKFGHYLVIGSKLANNNYAVRDPKWFATKTLNETDNISQNVRGYNKVFDTANLFTFSQTPQKIAAAMYLYLASPAEYLVTDPQGRRLGIDPTTNTTYNEILSGSYSLEGPILDSDTAVDPSLLHLVKTIYISSPVSGNYDVKVIGTGTGSYTANSFVYDNNGNSQSNIVQGNTTANLVADYNLSFSTSSSQGTTYTPTDTTPPVISHTTLATQYILNASPIQFTFNATDTGVGVFSVTSTLDGLAIQSSSTINFNQVGNHTIVIAASDFVGNTTSTTINYNVAYNFGGFLPPIRSDGSGIYSLGRTLPIKFQLTNATDSFISTAVAQLVVTNVQSGIAGTVPVDLATSTNDTNNLFRYDSADNQYIYNLDTGQLTTGAWQIKAVLDDGNSYVVLVSFR